MINQKLNKRFVLILILLVLYNGCFQGTRSNLEKGRTNHLLNFWVPLSKPGSKVYNHSILRSFRVKSDCQPNCPQINIWQYQYKDPKTQKIITSTKPIASQKDYWKVPFEARIIAISLFGDNPKYVDGLANFILSNQSLKIFNNIPASELWGYETFTFRVYVPKRNPHHAKKSASIKGTLPEAFIEKLLNLGCEVVFVDNDLDAVGVDSFFWRFMVFAEKMDPKQRIRYLVRDADWLLTGAEAFAVGEWINSGLLYHRSQLLPACMGPLFGGLWGGQHIGEGPLPNLKDYMDKFPYHLYYGDDEMFARDIIWPIMLDTGSILTHYYQEDFFFFMSEPYKNSCQRPTQLFCDEMNSKNMKTRTCIDNLIPNDLPYPYIRLGTMEDTKPFLSEPDFFDMHLETNERAQKAAKGLSLHPLSETTSSQ